LSRQAVEVRRSHRIKIWILPVLAAGVVATSCGSDRPPDSATTTPAATASAPTTEIPPATADSAPPTTPDLAPDPTSGAAVADEDAPSAVAADCRRLTDFDGYEADRWIVVNDGVMGGRSNGTITVLDSVMRFTGDVVTAGGGFTSVRLRLDGTELVDTTRVELRVRSDQRIYGLTLEDNAQAGQRAVSYRADLTIDEADDTDGWTTTELSFADLRPSVFGQPVDAPPFDPDEASEFGIIIADGRDGDFALDVDWIDACR